VKFITDERKVLYRGDDGRKHCRTWHKLFVLDEHGREHEFEIVSKVRRNL